MNTLRIVLIATLVTLAQTSANAQAKISKLESGTWEEIKPRPDSGMIKTYEAGNRDAIQTNSSKPEIGFNISQYQKDFGIGLQVISPYFMKKTMAIKAGTNIQWFENSSDTKTTWTTYQNIQLGMRGRSNMVTHNISIYGEGGVFIILPNSDFSSKSLVFGGYGLFGFEFKIVPGFAYFIELGGVGTGATADKIESKPIYSNGFFTNVGIKVGFRAGD